MKNLNLIVILILINFSDATEKTILFLYNAEDDFPSIVEDFIHKSISPNTYPCQLCKLTYGTFYKKKQWREFLSNLNYSYKFVYRNNDVNINYHGNQYPIILFGNLENNEVLVSTDELNACQTVEDLIEIIINKLKEN